MNKKDYLDALAKALDCLSREKRSEILSFYQEAIDDRIEEGMSEEEAVCAMGPVRLAAESILRGAPVVRERWRKQGAKSPALLWVLVIAGSPLWIPLAFAFLLAVASVYLCIWLAAAYLACGGGLHVRATVRFVSGMVRRDDGNTRLRSLRPAWGACSRRRPARVQRGVFGEPRFGSAFSEMDTKGRLSVQTLRSRYYVRRCGVNTGKMGAHMKEIWKTSRRVACVLAGLGIVLSLAGFALSGFDPRVFSAKVDRGTVSFGGTIVENPEKPATVHFDACRDGSVEYGVSSDEEVS